MSARIGSGRGFATYISTATDTPVSAGPGTLRRIIVGETAAGAITVRNGSASGTIIAVLKASIAEGTYEFDCYCSTAITITTAAASKLTVVTD